MTNDTKMDCMAGKVGGSRSSIVVHYRCDRAAKAANLLLNTKIALFGMCLYSTCCFVVVFLAFFTKWSQLSDKWNFSPSLSLLLHILLNLTHGWRFVIFQITRTVTWLTLWARKTWNEVSHNWLTQNGKIGEKQKES